MGFSAGYFCGTVLCVYSSGKILGSPSGWSLNSLGTGIGGMAGIQLFLLMVDKKTFNNNLLLAILCSLLPPIGATIASHIESKSILKKSHLKSLRISPSGNGLGICYTF